MRLKRHEMVHGQAATTRRGRRVRFDTPDRALTEAGVALYLIGRRQETESLRDRSGLLSTVAVERAPASGGRPRLGAFGDKSGLAPWFEVSFTETVYTLSGLGGEETRLALLIEEISGRKLELAHLSLPEGGSPDILYCLAEALTQAEGERAFLVSLARAEVETAAAQGLLEAPAYRTDIALPPGSTLMEAFVRTGRNCLEQIAANAPCVAAGLDREGLHQMRVGLRRLRSAMTLYKKILSGAEARRVRQELKWLSGVLGPARDMDVFIEEILIPVRKGPGLAALKSRFTAQRAGLLEAAVVAVRSPRFARLMLDLSRWLGEGTWRTPSPKKGQKKRIKRLSRPALDFATQVLGEDVAHVRDLGGDLRAMAPAERHALRIELKRLRYAGGFFASLFAERHPERLLKDLAALQDALGVLNDIAVAHGLLAGLAKGEEGPRLAQAARAVINHHDHRVDKALDKAVQCWESFAKDPLFWGSERPETRPETSSGKK